MIEATTTPPNTASSKPTTHHYYKIIIINYEDFYNHNITSFYDDKWMEWNNRKSPSPSPYFFPPILYLHKNFSPRPKTKGIPILQEGFQYYKKKVSPLPLALSSFFFRQTCNETRVFIGFSFMPMLSGDRSSGEMHDGLSGLRGLPLNWHGRKSPYPIRKYSIGISIAWGCSSVTTDPHAWTCSRANT